MDVDEVEVLSKHGGRDGLSFVRNNRASCMRASTSTDTIARRQLSK